MNAVTGTIKGFADNQGKQNAETKEAFANTNFYANIGVNAGFTKDKSEIKSHVERVVVTDITGIDENSSITYNNLKNIEYVGTKAENTTFVYNNVENVNKKVVELHNNFSSNSLSKGINAGVAIGYSNKVQTIGNGINVSANKSNQKTNETIYQNGSFVNVSEIHNNIKNMTLDGFNQEGGKVVGNIENLVIKSKQNISETDGYSLGGSVGIPIGSGAVSVNANTSQTVGNRAFIDNESSFVVGKNSNLKIKNVTNEAGIIGTNGQNSNIKIEKYVGKNIENSENLTTTGVSGGTGGVGVNYSNSEKDGITRNIIIGDIQIEKSSGDTINTDLNKANEITKDNQNSMNVNVESQTLEYAINQSKFKEDIEKAKVEIADIFTASEESIHDRGDDNRNFFGQLGEVRLSKTINNIAGEKLEKTDNSEEIARTFEDTYADLGYKNTKIIFTTPENTPQLRDEKGNPKAGTAYVDKETGKRTILINVNDEKNYTKAGLIGTIAEEGSHVINALENRKVETGTDEKGLESTGRVTNEYFKNLYSKNDKNITLKSDRQDYLNVDFGENVGDDVIIIHGGAGGTAKDVTGPRKKYEKNKLLKNVPKKEIDFTYSKKIFGQQLYSNDGVREIVNYKHKEGTPIIVWGHSLGADSVLEAYGIGYKGKKPKKADELNVIMPRVRFVEKYINNVSKNAKTVNLFMLKGDKELQFISDYGDRSFETLNKKKNKMPKNVKIVQLDVINFDKNFNIFNKSRNNHGPALMEDNKMLEQIWNEYKKVSEYVK